jgi:NADH-quinone oxidoreductase subunit C
VTKQILGEEIAHLIEAGFPGAVEEAQPEFAMIAPGKLVDVMTWLRDDPEHQYKFLSSLTGVDREDWFEIVYHLESIKHNKIVAIKVRSYDREQPKVPSMVPVWQGAHLQEREAYDLFGIVFEGHPDMRRIFLWEGFAGWPLRKDYLNLPSGQMPGLEHFPGEPGLEFTGRGTQ